MSNSCTFCRIVCYIYDNFLTLAGRDPKGGSSKESQEQIEALKILIGPQFPGIIYDGFAESPNHGNAQKICISSLKQPSFINLDFAHDFSHWSREIAPYQCRLEKIIPVKLPGWFNQ